MKGLSQWEPITVSSDFGMSSDEEEDSIIQLKEVGEEDVSCVL